MHKTKPMITVNKCDITSCHLIINPAYIQHEEFIKDQIKIHPEIMQAENCQAFKQWRPAQ